jgi:hypothetical protein
MKSACIACNAPCKLDMHALVKLSIYQFKVLTMFYPVKTMFYPVKTMFYPLGWVKLVLPGFLPTLLATQIKWTNWNYSLCLTKLIITGRLES